MCVLFVTHCVMWRLCLIHSSFLIIGAWSLLGLLQLVCIWSFRACWGYCNLYVCGASEFVTVTATCMCLELQSLLQFIATSYECGVQSWLQGVCILSPELWCGYCSLHAVSELLSQIFNPPWESSTCAVAWRCICFASIYGERAFSLPL